MNDKRNDEQVETKVVQIRLDSKQFQKESKKTVKSLKDIEKNLKFKGSKKDIEEIAKALDDIETEKLNKNLEETEGHFDKIKLTIKEIVKFKVVSKIVDDITDSLAGAAKSILGINNIMSGWDKYEENLNTIGGILNNVEREGKGLADVTKEMETLRWYTDETSFSFETLSNGIKQFTTAGVLLEDATKAAMGVTSLAGASKVFEPYKVQSAMDAVSKSMATGYMDVQRWTSLTNTAGIVTTEFSQALLDAAVAEGKLIKSQYGQYKTRKSGKLVSTENIRNTLSDKWLTDEVLTAALQRYSSGVEDVKNLIDQIESGAASDFVKGYISQQGWDESNITVQRAINILDELERQGSYTWDEIGKKALKSSQEATTFTQAIDSARVGVSSKFQQIFESIFGNVEEATMLWSGLAESFYDAFVAPIGDIADVFAEWHNLSKEEGGYELFVETVGALSDVLVKFTEVGKEAFGEVFGEYGAQTIGEFVKVLFGMTDSLRDNETFFTALKDILKVVLTLFKSIGIAVKNIFKAAFPVLHALQPLVELIGQGIIEISEFLIDILEGVSDLHIAEKTINGIGKGITVLTNGIKKIISAFGGRAKMEKLFGKIGSLFTKIGSAAGWLFEQLVDGVVYVVDLVSSSELLETALDKVGNAIDWVSGLFKAFVDILKSNPINTSVTNGFNAFINLFKNHTILDAFGTSLDWLKNKFNEFLDAEFFEKWKEKFDKLGQDTGASEGIASFTKWLNETIHALGDVFTYIHTEFVTNASLGLITLSDIVKALLLILGLFAAFKIVRLISGFAWAAESIGDLFHSLKRRINAGTISAIGRLFLMIAGAVGIMAVAIKVMEDVKVNQAWKAVGVISVLIAVMTGAIALINLTSRKNKTRGLLGFVTVAIGFMMVIRTMVKYSEDIAKIDIGQFTKLFAIITLLSGLSIAIMKMGKRMPTAWGMIKFLAVVNIMAYAMGELIEYWWGYHEKEVEQALRILRYAISAWAAIAVSMVPLSKALPKIKISNFFLILGGIAAILYATMTIAENFEKIEATPITMVATILGYITAIGLIMIGLGALGRVLKVRSMMFANIGPFLLAITATVALLIGMIKLANTLSEEEIKKGTNVVVSLFERIGMIAVLINLTSKVINSGGVKGLWSGGQRIATSSLGGAIIGITVSIGLCLLMFKLINTMSIGEITRGTQVVSKLLTMFVISIGSLLIIQKFTSRISFKQITKLLLSFAAVLATMIGALFIIDKIDDYMIARGLSVIAGMGLMITAFVTGMAAATRLAKDGRAIKDSVLLIITMTASIAALIGLVFLIDMLSAAQLVKAGVTIVAGLAIMITAAALFKKFVNQRAVFDEGKNAIMTATAIVVLLVGLVASMLLMKFVDLGSMAKTLGTLVVVIGALALVMQTFKESELKKEDAIALAILIGAVATAVLVMTGAMLLTKLVSGEEFLKMILILGTIIGSIAILMEMYSKKQKNLGETKLKHMTATLALIMASMVIFTGILLLMKLVSWEDYGKTAAAMATMFALVLGVYAIVNYMTKNSADVLKSVGMLVVFAVLMGAMAALLLAVSMMDTSKIDPNIFYSMSTLIASMALMVIGVGKFASGTGIVKAAGVILAMIVTAYLCIELMKAVSTDFDAKDALVNMSILAGAMAVLVGIFTGTGALAKFIALGTGAFILIEVALTGLVGVIELANLVFDQFVNTINKIDAGAIERFTMLGVSLTALSATLALTALSLPVEMVAVASAFGILFGVTKLVKESTIEKFGTLVDAINNLPSNEDATKRMQGVAEVLKTFATGLKQFSKVPSNTMTSVVSQIASVKTMMSTIQGTNGKYSISTYESLSYFSASLREIFEALDHYKPMKDRSNFKKDMEMLFGGDNSGGTLTNAIEGLDGISKSGFQYKESITAIKSMIEVMDAIAKFDESDIQNIYDFEKMDIKGTVFGTQLVTLISDFTTAFTTLDSKTKYLDYDRVTKFADIVSSILTAFAAFGKKTTNLEKRYIQEGMNQVKETSEIVETFELPNNFGERIGDLVNHFATALASNYSRINGIKIGDKQLDTFTTIFQLCLDWLNSMATISTSLGSDAAAWSTFTMAISTYANALPVIIDSLITGMEKLSAVNILSKSSMQDKADSMKAAAVAMNEIFDTIIVGGYGDYTDAVNNWAYSVNDIVNAMSEIANLPNLNTGAGGLIDFFSKLNEMIFNSDPSIFHNLNETFKTVYALLDDYGKDNEITLKVNLDLSSLDEGMATLDTKIAEMQARAAQATISGAGVLSSNGPTDLSGVNGVVINQNFYYNDATTYTYEKMKADQNAADTVNAFSNTKKVGRQVQ